VLKVSVLVGGWKDNHPGLKATPPDQEGSFWIFKELFEDSPKSRRMNRGIYTIVRNLYKFDVILQSIRNPKSQIPN
jgi:hypothetical protein